MQAQLVKERDRVFVEAIAPLIPVFPFSQFCGVTRKIQAHHIAKSQSIALHTFERRTRILSLFGRFDTFADVGLHFGGPLARLRQADFWTGTQPDFPPFFAPYRP